LSSRGGMTAGPLMGSDGDGMRCGVAITFGVGFEHLSTASRALPIASKSSPESFHLLDNQQFDTEYTTCISDNYQWIGIAIKVRKHKGIILISFTKS
jgi:hypothetical protein